MKFSLTHSVLQIIYKNNVRSVKIISIVIHGIKIYIFFIICKIQDLLLKISMQYKKHFTFNLKILIYRKISIEKGHHLIYIDLCLIFSYVYRIRKIYELSILNDDIPPVVREVM